VKEGMIFGAVIKASRVINADKEIGGARFQAKLASSIKEDVFTSRAKKSAIEIVKVSKKRRAITRTRIMR